MRGAAAADSSLTNASEGENRLLSQGELCMQESRGAAVFAYVPGVRVIQLPGDECRRMRERRAPLDHVSALFIAAASRLHALRVFRTTAGAQANLAFAAK